MSSRSSTGKICDDKHVVRCWIRIYNRLLGAAYEVIEWPDADSSRANIDALCKDLSGNLLAVEHTRIEPFQGEKLDADRFMRTLAALENDPGVLQPGYELHVVQPVGSIPSGIDWKHIQSEQRQQLKRMLPNLPEGPQSVTIVGKTWSVRLHVTKTRLPGSPGKFSTARVWPGDPGPELVIKALRKKVPKLSKYATAKRILLLEKDAVAGTIESQFEQLSYDDDPEIRRLLGSIEEIWSVNTACLAGEDTLFTNQLWPSMRLHVCSLNIRTNSFWKLER